MATQPANQIRYVWHSLPTITFMLSVVRNSITLCIMSLFSSSVLSSCSSATKAALKTCWFQSIDGNSGVEIWPSAGWWQNLSNTRTAMIHSCQCCFRSRQMENSHAGYLVVFSFGIQSHVDSERGRIVMGPQTRLLIWSVPHHEIHQRLQLQQNSSIQYNIWTHSVDGYERTPVRPLWEDNFQFWTEAKRSWKLVYWI